MIHCCSVEKSWDKKSLESVAIIEDSFEKEATVGERHLGCTWGREHFFVVIFSEVVHKNTSPILFDSQWLHNELIGRSLSDISFC